MGRAERISAVILLAGGVFVTGYSYYHLKLGILISPGAGFLPFLCGVSLIILAIVWMIKNLLIQPSEQPAEEDGPTIELSQGKVSGLRRLFSKMVLGIAVLIVYAWLFEKVGYFVSTALFMLGWQLLLEKESFVKAFTVTALAAGTMYILFQQLLGVHLPPGTWWP